MPIDKEKKLINRMKRIGKYKKVIIICILIGVGFIPFVSIREIINRDYTEKHIPYEYGQEDGQVARYPDEMDYTNKKIYWYFNSSNYLGSILVVMNDEQYYEFQELAYKTETFSELQSLAFVKYYTLLYNDVSGEGYRKPPYLDWWCLIIITGEATSGTHGITYAFGSGGFSEIINIELSLIISSVYFASIIILFFLNRKYDLKT